MSSKDAACSDRHHNADGVIVLFPLRLREGGIGNQISVDPERGVLGRAVCRDAAGPVVQIVIAAPALVLK